MPSLYDKLLLSLFFKPPVHMVHHRRCGRVFAREIRSTSPLNLGTIETTEKSISDYE